MIISNDNLKHRVNANRAVWSRMARDKGRVDRKIALA